MKHSRVGLAAVLGLALLSIGWGCEKKSADQANATGFETMPSTEELAQLPQTTGSANQQAAIEILPVENSPATPAMLPTETAVSDTLSYNQKIQTALKNAGFYSGSIDGKIGPATRKAIQGFQENHSLKVDGKVGPKTWAALEPYLKGEPSSTALSTASD